MLVQASLFAKTLIVTHNYNRPDFIEIQYKTLKKFLQDDFEYVVFNDSNKIDMYRQIEKMCQMYGIRSISVPQELHNDDVNASFRHATAVKYSLETVGYGHDGIVFILDCDIILVRPFSVAKYMEDRDIAGRINRPRHKAVYLSPLFCILNMNKLPEKTTLSFDCAVINDLLMDTGGASHYYLLEHPELKIIPVSILYSHQLFLADKHVNKYEDIEVSEDIRRGFYEHCGFNQNEIEFLLKRPDTFEFYLDNFFLHYRGSSYTNGDAYKFRIFKEFLEKL
jgi:hypothetical protein